MKAQVLYGVNDLRYEEVEKPVPGKDQVLVKVEAVGICGSDIPRIYQTGAHRHPLIPGHEFAGTICGVGEHAEELYKLLQKDNNENDELMGMRVGVFPLIPCGECGPCKSKQYEMCRNYNYLGSRCDGGFAEYVNVPVKNIIKLPDNVSFEDAAMLEPTSVAAHSIRRTFNCVKNKDNNLSVVVIGLGTIGLLIVMHLINEARDKGISNIFVVGNKSFQKEKASGLGIPDENYCDSTKEDVSAWIMEKTDGYGADVIFECVGKNDTYELAIGATAPAGAVMLVGNPYSDMKLEKNIYWKILRNQLTVLGTWNSSFTGDADDDWHYVVNGLNEGRIKPSDLISHRMQLEDLEKGLHIMRDKTEDYVKVMIIN